MERFIISIASTLFICLYIFIRLMADSNLWDVRISFSTLITIFLYVAFINILAAVFFVDLNYYLIFIILCLLPLLYFYYQFNKRAVSEYFRKKEITKEDNEKKNDYLPTQIILLVTILIIISIYQVENYSSEPNHVLLSFLPIIVFIIIYFIFINKGE